MNPFVILLNRLYELPAKSQISWQHTDAWRRRSEFASWSPQVLPP